MKTLKFLALGLCFFIMSQSLMAQVRVSPKVGVNLSGLDTKLTDFDAEARAGWHAGLDLRLGEGFIFLNPGIQYQSYTARLVQSIDENTQVNFSEETTIQSLKAPLNLGIRITGDNGLLGLHVKGGIVPTYVMGVKEVDGFNFSEDRLNRLTWGANMGVGIDLLFLTADLTYEKGLTNFFEDAEGKNNVLSLSVGLKF
ncbi:MAG: porin family protein [Bacteroidota bacterium]